RRPGRRHRPCRRPVPVGSPGPSRRALRRPGGLVVQRPAVEHRAAPPPQPAGPHTGRGRAPCGRGGRRHEGGLVAAVALDPQLLDILACPEDKRPLLYFQDEDALYNPRLKRRYAIRDDIPIMLIDEAETVS